MCIRDSSDPGQRDMARALLDAGADLVVGHHPHVVQETATAAELGLEERHGLVAYSLGNLLFDQAQPETRRGLVLRAFFDRDGLRAVQALPVQAGLRPGPIPPGPPSLQPKGGASSPPLAGEDPTPVPAAQAQAGRIASGEGSATRVAREEYVSERLRLLYVGITRARRTLIVTWNTGRREGVRLEPALPLVALHEAWQEEGTDA